RGASESVLDSVNRLLLPKQLIQYAGIDKEIVLFAFSNRIEIWAKDAYEKLQTNEPEDFSSLAEDVMGKKENRENTNDLP
ncbi:MAG TPA: division/cell wall cluster transcriptional repressor MraZ, partial [Bacteroidales bacterium]|nr:division/cell wall cluster transcriptional repressor MraZ [Bacteroidales bacterium]